MTRDDLIKLLKDYKKNKAKSKIKNKELIKNKLKLRRTGDADTRITTTFGINQDIHSKNKISNKVLQKVEENETQKEEIKRNINELEQEIKELKEKIEAVEDRLECLTYKERELLSAYYFEGRTYEDVGNNVYFEKFKQTRDKDTIRDIIEKAVQKMIKL